MFVTPSSQASVDRPSALTAASLEPGASACWQIHRQAQIALPRRLTVQQPTELEPARHRQRRLHVTRGQRALDLKAVLAAIGVDVPAPRKRAADQLDHPIGQVRKVRQRLVLHLAVLAERVPQQMRHVLATRPLPTVGDDMHRAKRTRTTAHTQKIPPPPDK